jgi:hypothetical protein
MKTPESSRMAWVPRSPIGELNATIAAIGAKNGSGRPVSVRAMTHAAVAAAVS